MSGDWRATTGKELTKRQRVPHHVQGPKVEPIHDSAARGSSDTDAGRPAGVPALRSAQAPTRAPGSGSGDA
jgi:hypothetical protein